MSAITKNSAAARKREEFLFKKVIAHGFLAMYNQELIEVPFNSNCIPIEAIELSTLFGWVIQYTIPE